MVRYSIEIGQQEQDILKEIVLASDKNVKKRKFATRLSSVMAVIMLIYASSRFLGRQRMSFPDLAHRESVDTEDD